MMKRFAYFSLTLGLTAAAAVQADTLTLTNNDRLSGQVVSIAGGQVLFKTEHLGTLSVPMNQVAGIDKTDPITVRTANGQELTGVLATADGRQVIETEGGAALVSVDEVSQAFENYLGAPDHGQIAWDSRVDLGYVLSTGNSETETRSLHGEAIAKHGRYEHRLFLGLDQDEADDETTKDQLDASYDLRYYFREQWYALGNLGYFQDKVKDIDQRITVGAGLGHLFWDNSLGALSAELGVSQVFEDLDGNSESNPAVRWGLNFNRWLRPEAIEVFHNHEILSILGSGRGQILNASTGLRLHVSDNWNANARVDVIHETEPQPGRKKTDVTYVVGFGYIF